MELPDSIQRLVKQLSRLPSIGPRQGTRLVFYLLSQGTMLESLARDIASLVDIKLCERCFFVHENTDTLCAICRNPARRKDIIMIIEKETDLLSLENTNRFKGRYLIIGPIPKTGILEDWQKLRLQALKDFITKELAGKADSTSSPQAEEIIMGFNPTSLGDFQASLLIKELGPFTKKISRLGRGLPLGGEIEFADENTLTGALENRRE